MRVVLSWLREFCPTDASPDDLAELLTSRGAKVEDIVRPWERLSGVVVARVLEVRDHPGSDRLYLARVTTGSAEREVVVGVRNMTAGDLVPLAGPGATVPALSDPIDSREIRGVVSDGMLCSPYELAVTQEHTGILVLPEDLEPGRDVKEALGLDDSVLDIEVTPNRPDFLSVVGIAREVAAVTGAPLTLPPVVLAEDDEKAADVATVEIVDLARCPRYLARVLRDASHVAAPITVQARLTAAGMRSISAIVDATNYAMLELGHPMHPFDLALLDGPGIIVRRAEPGERMRTLDDVERTFTDDDLLIADRARPVAVAGVMGGAVAEVSETSTDLLLESAYFERSGVMRTARRIGLSSEASLRFERGADPECVPRAADRACGLISRWTGARVLAGAIDVGEAPPRRHISMRASRASLLLGYDVTPADATDAIGRLGLDVVPDGEGISVEVPGYRVDLEREVDLIEEVVRVQGYDRVGSALPAVRQSGGLPPAYAFLGRLRRALVRGGLREVWLLSFASAEDLELTGDEDGVAIANPLAAEEGYLRTRLTPGLLRALARNLARQVRGAALFEVGKVFRTAETVQERFKVAFAMTGGATQSWAEPERELDFFDAKGALEALFDDLGIAEWSLGGAPGSLFHPARSAFVLIGDQRAGVVGEVHPTIVERLDLTGRVAVGELEVDVLMRHAVDGPKRRDVSRFPPVRRDLAFVVESETPAAAVTDALREAGGELVESSLLFDVFEGDPLPAGKKSLAFSIDLRAVDRTLSAEEADAVVGRMVERIARDLGGELRTG